MIEAASQIEATSLIEAASRIEASSQTKAESWIESSLSEMSNKCRRYVADPNIECFRASHCDAIVYREKIFGLYPCRCNGVVRKILNLSVIYRIVWFAY